LPPPPPLAALAPAPSTEIESLPQAIAHAPSATSAHAATTGLNEIERRPLTGLRVDKKDFMTRLRFVGRLESYRVCAEAPSVGPKGVSNGGDDRARNQDLPPRAARRGRGRGRRRHRRAWERRANPLRRPPVSRWSVDVQVHVHVHVRPLTEWPSEQPKI